MAPFTALVVAEEKELDEFCDRVKKAGSVVGPMSIHSASKAVDAVGKLQRAQQATGVIHVALLNTHFTAPGKAEFGDTLRKVLRDKYPDVPIVAWGNANKAGKLGEHYHYAIDCGHNINQQELNQVLLQVKNGDIVSSWTKGSKKKSAEGRPGAPAGGRKSMEGSGQPARRPSMDSHAPVRRRSMDGKPGQQSPRTRSIDHGSRSLMRNSFEAERGSSMPRMGSMGMGGMGGMGTLGGMGGMGMGSMGSMSSMGSMTGMGMGGLGGGMMGGGLGSLGSGMGGMGKGAGGMGMSSMGGMSPMGVADPMLGMGAAAGGMGMGVGMGPLPATGMGMPPAMGGPGSGLGAGLGLGGMGMGGMGMGAPMMELVTPTPPAPAPAATGSNGELIKMLTEEMQRLKKAVDEKRSPPMLSPQVMAGAAMPMMT